MKFLVGLMFGLYAAGANATCDRGLQKVSARRVSVEPLSSGAHGAPEERVSTLLVKVDNKIICAISFAGDQIYDFRKKLQAAHSKLAAARKAGAQLELRGDQIDELNLDPNSRKKSVEPHAEVPQPSH